MPSVTTVKTLVVAQNRVNFVQKSMCCGLYELRIARVCVNQQFDAKKCENEEPNDSNFTSLRQICGLRNRVVDHCTRLEIR